MPAAKKTPAKPAKRAKPAAAQTAARTTVAAKPAAPKAPKLVPQAETVPAVTAAAAPAAATSEATVAGELVEEAAERMSRMVSSVPEAVGAPGFGNLMALHKAGVEAFVQAGGVMYKGMGEVNKELVSFARSTTDAQVAGAKALMQAKSLDELMGMQAELARASLERLVSQTNKLGALALDTASKTGAPLARHWSAALKSLSGPTSA